MGYGPVYIESDLEKLKRQGVGKSERIDIIARRIKYRYCDIPLDRARTIAKSMDEGRDPPAGSWRRGKRCTKIKVDKDRWKKYGLGSL